MAMNRSRRDFFETGSDDGSCISCGSGQRLGSRHQVRRCGNDFREDSRSGRRRHQDLQRCAVRRRHIRQNRFMPPADPAKWTGVRDALEFGHSAPQTEPGARRATSDLAVAAAGLPD